MMNHSPLSSRPRVLVTGASGPAGSSLLTQLWERGVPVLGVDMAPRPRPDGLRILQCPPATAPEFVSALAAICEEYSIDLLIPTVDEELSVLAPLRTALLHRARIAVAPTAAVAIAADKWLTHRVAESSGLAVPRSLEAPTLTEEGAYWLGFPYVVRPRVARGGAGCAWKQHSHPLRHCAIPRWSPLSCPAPNTARSSTCPSQEVRRATGR